MNSCTHIKFVALTRAPIASALATGRTRNRLHHALLGVLGAERPCYRLCRMKAGWCIPEAYTLRA